MSETQTHDFVLRRLGVYYGWPSAFDGARSLDEAISKIGAYDLMVFGWGLQERRHLDHERAKSIIAALAGRTSIYGYIPMGSATGLSARKIRKAAKAWRAAGAAGVLLDEAGYDYGNTRKRQNKAYECCHEQGLRVIANAWRPADLLGTAPGAHNKSGLSPSLAPGDALLYESYRIREGALEETAEWRSKIEALCSARERGVEVMGIATGANYQQRLMDHLVLCALLDGLDAVGWGEPDYAARDNQMPLRPWPALPATADIRHLSALRSIAGRLARDTSIGRVEVDALGGGRLVSSV